MKPAPTRTGEALAALAGVLPEGAPLTREDDLERYSRDWTGDHYGRPLAVARPSGRVKRGAFLERVDAVALDLAGRLKDAFDPLHLLSDGRILAPWVERR